MHDSMHNRLVMMADRWANNTLKAAFTLTDFVTYARERPDIVAFKAGESVLIECKASMSDFRADAKKHFRIHPELGMGSYRFYFCQEGLIPEAEVPDKWGLLYVTKRGVRVIKGPDIRHMWFVGGQCIRKLTTCRRSIFMFIFMRFLTMRVGRCCSGPKSRWLILLASVFVSGAPQHIEFRGNSKCHAPR